MHILFDYGWQSVHDMIHQRWACMPSFLSHVHPGKLLSWCESVAHDCGNLISINKHATMAWSIPLPHHGFICPRRSNVSTWWWRRRNNHVGLFWALWFANHLLPSTNSYVACSICQRFFRARNLGATYQDFPLCTDGWRPDDILFYLYILCISVSIQ